MSDRNDREYIIHQSILCGYFYQAHCKPEPCWTRLKQIQKARQILKFWGWYSYQKNEEIPIVVP